MRRRKKYLKYGMNIMRNVRGIILCMAVLGGQTGGFQLVYGSAENAGYSEFQSFDTGGFDMDIGEGTGQFPDNWDSADSGSGSQIDDGRSYGDYGDYSESGNTGGDVEISGLGSAAGNGESDWSGNNDTWQDSTQWGNTQTESGNYYGTDNGENAGSGNSENSGSTGSISWNESNYGTEDSFQISGSTNSGDNRNTGNHRSEATLTPKISASPTPVLTRKPEKTKNPTYPPKVSKSPRISPASQKQQKLALFYYRTDKTADA